MAALSRQVLRTYRRALKVARDWKASSGSDMQTRQEQEYIRNEARRLFRKNKFITDSAEIAACLQEGHSRLEMALHYKIPYPRPVNVPPNFVPTMKTSKKQKQKTHEAKPIYMHSLDS